MTLKNSFLASLKENNKRRIWLWIVSFFAFVIILPSSLAMVISQNKSNLENYIEAYGEAAGSRMIYNEVIHAITSMLCEQRGAAWLVVATIAAFCGIQGFSYLYHKKKIDFYNAMPIRRKKRFLVIWLNGVAICVVPYLIGVLVSLLIVACNGFMTADIFVGAWQMFALNLCFFLGVYHLTMLAVMLTGHVIITYCAMGVLFLYECIVRLMMMGYMELFFKMYSHRSMSTEPALSPFTMLFSYDAINGGLLKSACSLLIFAACTGTVAYIAYLKRPAEAAGKAIAFSWPKPWLKILITIPATLMVGLAVASMVNYNPIYGKTNFGVVLFAMVVATIFMCCLMQVIYEFDIKGMLHKKSHIVISAVAVALIFCVFRYDLFGYDTYIPNPEKVESAFVEAPIDDYSYYGNSYWDKDMQYMSRMQFVEEHMYLTDIGSVNKLLQLSIDAVDGYENLDKLYDDTERNWHTVNVTFRMANKREISRSIWVDVNNPEMAEVIDRIESSEEFISGAYMGTSDELTLALNDENRKATAYFGNGIYRVDMKREEAKELLKLYQEDIRNSSFLKFRENVCVGSMVLSFEKKNEHYTSYAETALQIYPFYEKSIAYLKEKGYYMDGYLNPEDVERIQVTNYHSELVEDANEQEEVAEFTQAGFEAATMVVPKEYGELNDFTTRITYESEEDIEKLCDSLYPRDYLYQSWHNANAADDDYTVIVYFKPESEVGIDNDGMAYYGFALDEVPEFVEKDTAYDK